MRTLPLLLALGIAAPAGATEIGNGRAFGLGLQLGAPSAITGKFYLGGRQNAIDFAVGAFYDDYGYVYDGLYVQAAYHFHLTELTSGNGVTIPFRIGIGGFLGSWNYGWSGRWDYGVVIGARVPFGLDFDLESAPVQFYLEVAPQVTVLPPLGIGADGGIGFRYYF